MIRLDAGVWDEAALEVEPRLPTPTRVLSARLLAAQPLTPAMTATPTTHALNLISTYPITANHSHHPSKPDGVRRIVRAVAIPAARI